MTDHRRRAEDLELHESSCDYANPKSDGELYIAECDCDAIKRIITALKEVEEETFARAVNIAERFLKPYIDKGSDGQLVASVGVLAALREEAKKEGSEI